MTSLLEYLESFNRKERFFLIGEALGNTDFRLSDDFRSRLSEAFGIAVPADALVAMDYHLDWIHASLHLSLPGVDEEAVHINTDSIATGKMEDVDLLVAFQEGQVTHILLIEAKAETGWSNKQMDSKSQRLEKIFGANGMKHPSVKPHFCMMSPRPPQELNSDTWPGWMSREGIPTWLSLSVPKNRRRVTRCNESGETSSDGMFFRILTTKSSEIPI